VPMLLALLEMRCIAMLAVKADMEALLFRPCLCLPACSRWAAPPATACSLSRRSCAGWTATACCAALTSAAGCPSQVGPPGAAAAAAPAAATVAGRQQQQLRRQRLPVLQRQQQQLRPRCSRLALACIAS
jgi:hypothetical protein